VIIEHPKTLNKFVLHTSMLLRFETAQRASKAKFCTFWHPLQNYARDRQNFRVNIESNHLRCCCNVQIFFICCSVSKSQRL